MQNTGQASRRRGPEDERLPARERPGHLVEEKIGLDGLQDGSTHHHDPKTLARSA
jgi:hypothetical protein